MIFTMSKFVGFYPPMGRRQWHPTPVLLPGKSHGRRSLVGCSPWGRYELDMTERLHFHFSLSCIGERNGNPLQCSCLENPRDGGAWWAAIYGVAQSRTRLKDLAAGAAASSSGVLEFPFGKLNFCFFLVSFLCRSCGIEWLCCVCNSRYQDPSPIAICTRGQDSF